MGLFSPDRSNIQTMFSMEQRITQLERARFRDRENRTNELELSFELYREVRKELSALYDYLGIEPKSLSGITFVKKGKD